MSINIRDEYGMELEIEERIEEIFSCILKVLEKDKDYDVSLTFVSNPKIQEINREYRNIDKETDVISFAINDDNEFSHLVEDSIDLGDIFISIDQASIQAEQLKQSLIKELEFLFIHGVLHLFGYDHIQKDEEEIMFSLQRKIVDELY